MAQRPAPDPVRRARSAATRPARPRSPARPSSSPTRHTSSRSSSTSTHAPADAGKTTWSPGLTGIRMPACSHQSRPGPTASTIPCCGGGSCDPGGTSRPDARIRSGSSSLTTTRSKRGRRLWRISAFVTLRMRTRARPHRRSSSRSARAVVGLLVHGRVRRRSCSPPPAAQRRPRARPGDRDGRRRSSACSSCARSRDVGPRLCHHRPGGVPAAVLRCARAATRRRRSGSSAWSTTAYVAERLLRDGQGYARGYADRVIAAQRRSGQAANDVVATGEGKRRMDALRSDLALLRGVEQRRRRRRQRAAGERNAEPGASCSARSRSSASLGLLTALADLPAAGGSPSDKQAADGRRARRARAKSEFLSRMSHELRTPLNVGARLRRSCCSSTEPGRAAQRERVDQILTAAGICWS